jgi:hypothetical protein
MGAFPESELRNCLQNSRAPASAGTKLNRGPSFVKWIITDRSPAHRGSERGHRVNAVFTRGRHRDRQPVIVRVASDAPLVVEKCRSTKARSSSSDV